MAAVTRNLGSVNRWLSSQLFSARVTIMPGYLCLSIDFSIYSNALHMSNFKDERIGSNK